MKHNRWLDWKIRHGLVIRGRSNALMEPKGVIAKFLYRHHFKKLDVAPSGGRVFKQSVGGSLGPSGDMK